MGRTVQNIPDDCLAAKFYQAEVDATGLGKLAETAKVAQNYGLQYLAGTGDMDTVTVESLSDLDAEISNLIRLGEKVVLLGASAVIEPKIVSSDHADMNRKPLAITDEKPYWGTFPEKQFDGCGLIKIDPTFKVGETSYEAFSDTSKWSCDKAGDYAKFSLPLKTGDRVLVVSFTQSKDRNGDPVQGSYEQYLNLTFAFDGVTYPADSSLPFSPNAPGSWSYTCNSQTIKVGENTLQIGQYQVQADGGAQFGMAVDCTPLFGEMVWVTLIGFLLLTFIMAAALAAVLAIETPSKFETSRSKPLIIPEAQ